MPKDYIKFIKKSPYRKQLEQLIRDLAHNTLEGYDIKKVSGHRHRYRIRIGQIRCTYEKIDHENYIIEINKRGDMYRK